MAAITAPIPARVPSLRFVGVAALAPIVLLLVRLLPAEGVGLALRLAAAGFCVLILPGALILRALGWPNDVGVALAGSISLSLALVFFALGLTFLAAGSLSLTLVIMVTVVLAAAAPAALAPVAAYERADLLSALGTAIAGCGVGAAVWWAAGPVTGDAMFHLSRVRKLDDFGSFSSLQSINELRDGLLHPGYAFPLWHGALALIARLAGVDPTQVVTYLSALLVPLAFVLTYAAGAILFKSWAGGIATAAAQAALVGFQARGIGAFQSLALPSTLSARVLPFAFLALGVAYVRVGGLALLACFAASSLALAVIHPTYAVFLALPFAGYLVARVLLAPEARRSAGRMAGAMLALSVPPLAFFAWLFPVIRDFSAVTPSHAVRAREIQHYRGYLIVMGDYLRIAPRALARGGPATVAAFLAMPFACLSGRRSWAAYVLGAALAIFPILLVPYLFTPFSEVASLSQARRLATFLPFPFALAGAFVLLGRLRLGAVVLAFAAALLLDRTFTHEFGYQVREGGPGWVVWFAFLGCAVGIVVAFFVRSRGPAVNRWAAAAALAFSLPLAVSGFSGLTRDPPDPTALTPGLVRELQTEVKPGDLVFADVDVAFEVVTYAPVYIPAGPAWQQNVKASNPYKRRLDVTRFFAEDTPIADRRRLLSKYGARWLVVDKSRPYPADFVHGFPLVYADSRYALYRVKR